MSLSGVFEVLRGRPHHPVGADGKMALSDHFRELRARIIRMALYLVLGTVVAFFFWDQLFALIFKPYQDAADRLGESVDTKAVISGVGGPLMLQLKLCSVAGVVGSAPLWLREIWGFLVPGLHAHERKWSRIFMVIAGPLFILGVAVGYYVLPKGIEVLLGFTQGDLESLVDFGEYYAFVTRMLLVFGIAFEIPVFVIMLNLTGMVSGRALGRYRPFIIVATFVFAAVATPSTDPFSMLMLALPMVLLFFLAELIARLVDRRRARAGTTRWADDEASPP